MNNSKSGESLDEWPLKPDNPARRALLEIGITDLKQLTKFSEAELLKLHGVGPKAIRMLREALAGRGLAFRQPGSTRTLRKPSIRRTPG